MNSSDTPDSKSPPESLASEEAHQGYNLETGVLARIREWTDLLPWIRLSRTLRAAASPPLLMMVAITYAIWSLGMRSIAAKSDAAAETMQSHLIYDYFRNLLPTTVFDVLGHKSWQWTSLLAIVWTILIWGPTILVLLRQGALLTAGRSMMGLTDAIHLSIRRAITAWLMAIVPLACLAAIALLILVLSWISPSNEWIEMGFAAVIALIAIPCGVLAFGACAAVPLGWSAIINEEEPDSLDSLSRGYEYLYRRPMHLVGYIVVAAIISLTAIAIAFGISWAAQDIVSTLLSVSRDSDSLARTTNGILECVPLIAAITTIWGLVGGIYLMLRRDAGGQEVEDIWAPTKKMPELPKVPLG